MMEEAGAAADAGMIADSASSEAGDASDGGCDPDADSPADLSCTGLYSDWPGKTIAPSAMAYTPAFTLWSDGAQKSRWIYLPPGSTIDTSDMDDWTFPVGTKVWKEFRWPEADAGTAYVGVPAGQRIETRLLWKKASGWDVLDLSLVGRRELSAPPPRRSHEPPGDDLRDPFGERVSGLPPGSKVDFLLGFDLIGTGGPGAQGLTLAALVDGGRLTDGPPATTVQIPEDATGLSGAALGFLHMNCGVSCHNSDCSAEAAGTGVRFKLLADQMYPEGGAGQVTRLDSYTTTVNMTASLMPNGMPYLLISPGNAPQSLVPRRYGPRARP